MVNASLNEEDKSKRRFSEIRGLDKTDMALIQILKANSRAPYREIASKLDLSVTAVYKRMQELIQSGAISNFTLRINPYAADAVPVFIFGQSSADSIDSAVDAIGKNENTSEVCVASGNYLYITAVLKSIADLESYAASVNAAAKMNEPSIGLPNAPHESLQKTITAKELTQLDFRIIHALRDNARESISHIAAGLGVSAKTASKRLERLITGGAVVSSIRFRPESSSEIAVTFHINLKYMADPGKTEDYLLKKYAEDAASAVSFSNITDLVLLFVSARTMNDVRDVHERLKKESVLESVVPHISCSTHFFDTWLDRLVLDKAARPAGPARSDLKPAARKRKASIRDFKVIAAYQNALEQALEDGVITDDEGAILKTLRDSLPISESEHNAILELIRLKKNKGQQDVDTYFGALAQALEDGVITDDEDAILRSLREALNINESEHVEMVQRIRRKNKEASLEK